MSVRILGIAAALTMTVSALPTGILLPALIASADTVEQDGMTFEENNSGGLTLTQYSGDALSVTVPASMNGKSVTEIGAYAFSGHEYLRTVNLSGCTALESIGDTAFGDCPYLKTVTLPASLESLGYWAFAWCGSLTTVSINDSLKEIGDGAFTQCTKLASVTLPPSLESIGGGAFCNCPLTSVTLPDSVTVIGDEAFMSCPLTEITLSASLTAIGRIAFYGTLLEEVTIPAGVTVLDGRRQCNRIRCHMEQERGALRFCEIDRKRGVYRRHLRND